MPITQEEYDELDERRSRFEDQSCSCHINPPCSKCTDSLSDEELNQMKEFEEIVQESQLVAPVIKEATFDCETTGLPPKKIIEQGVERESDYSIDFLLFPRIVTLAWKINDDPSKEYIINQEGREIPIEASNIHGITTEIANASPHFILPVLLEFIQDCKDNNIICGHNLYFDTSITKSEVLRLLLEGKISQESYDLLENILHKDKRIDTMRKTISFCNFPGRKWPKLTELYLILFNEEFNAHSAKDDVDATRRCLVELRKRGII